MVKILAFKKNNNSVMFECKQFFLQSPIVEKCVNWNSVTHILGHGTISQYNEFGKEELKLGEERKLRMTETAFWIYSHCESLALKKKEV